MLSPSRVDKLSLHAVSSAVMLGGLLHLCGNLTMVENTTAGPDKAVKLETLEIFKAIDPSTVELIARKAQTRMWRRASCCSTSATPPTPSM